MTKAYTLIEVLIVVGVLALLTGLASLSVVSFGQTGDIEAARAVVSGALKESQANSMAEEDQEPWGVHFESARVVIFRDSGSGFIAGASSNIVRVLPNKTTLSWALSSGGDTLEFSLRTGKPDKPGTITFQGSAPQTQTLTINSEGMIE